MKYLGTVRARVGGSVPFANTDVLLYGTAGLAWERVNRTDSAGLAVPLLTQTVATTTPRDHFGWVAGAGGEVRLGATNWIGRVEYLHYDFGTVETATSVTVTGVPGSFADKGGRQTIDVVSCRTLLQVRFRFFALVGLRSQHARESSAAGRLELGRLLYRCAWRLRLEAK